MKDYQDALLIFLTINYKQQETLNLMENNLNSQKTVLITGASGGIGKACTLALVQRGFYVFAGVRNLEDGQTLKQLTGNNLTPLRLDLTNSQTIREARELIAEIVGQKGLYGLVNNAGILKSAPIESIPISDLKEQFEVNVIGQISIIQEFLPLIRISQGKIINISSVAGFLAFPFMGAYCGSKFAWEAITDSLRMELKSWGISVVSIQPPFVKTSLWAKALKEDKIANLNVTNKSGKLYEKAIKKQRDKALEEIARAIAPEKVAKIVINALTTRKPKARYLVGTQAYLGAILNQLPSRLKDWIILKKFGLES